MYLVLGCDDVGFSVASKLKERGVEVVVVDKDTQRVRQLKLMGYNAVLGDFRLPEVIREAGIERAEMVLIMTPDFSTIRAALGAINTLKVELKVDPVVVARVLDDAEIDEVKRLGASDALPSSQLLANFAISKFEGVKEMVKEKRLRALLRELSRGRMAIILQTNPDPDSIASGVALKRYVKAFGVDADIIYDGIIGHPQNRALVNLLELNLLEAEKVDFKTYNSFALVDVSTHANCAMPKEILPTIVIDHHPVPSGEVKARFQDLTFVGAASTLLTNYLRYAAVEVDPATAAALVIGILTDTMNFTRGATPLDFDAFEYLMKLADADVLRRLQAPTVSPDAFDLFARAIKASKIREGFLTVNLGEVKDRDLLAQAADFLLIREGVTTTFVYGICDNLIYASARTKDVTLHLGQTLQRAFSEMGSAGGHARMAGATIPLGAIGRISKARLRREIDRTVGRKFLETAGVIRPYKPRQKRTKRK
ncbi:MAG: DHH family phosphoesterase [Candidatus Hodarchaeaceae archaeon]|nr:DHH family phosphoesterase [Candidatus Hodarchaeaceae archaeon]